MEVDRRVSKSDLARLAMASRGLVLEEPKADFRNSARKARLSSLERYRQQGTLLTAAFKGLEELGINDPEEAIAMVATGLEALGITVI